MSLQFVIGSSGAGKSCYAYGHVIQESMKYPKRQYYVIVPEQFTMQTQKTLVEMHPGRGILNIDVLSFQRLAYRIIQETGGNMGKLLEDTGKSMVLQKVVQMHKGQLPYLGGQMKRPGCLDEVKSLISEFLLYDIGDSDLEDMVNRAEQQPLLHMKLQDIQVLYKGFKEYLEGHYITGEEILDALLPAVPLSEKLKDSVIVLDGFTGFTPIQVKVIRELLAVCQKVMVTVTMDGSGDVFAKGKPHQLFYMSRQMIHILSALTRDMEEPVCLTTDEKSRFSQAPALKFLEKHIFRYSRKKYEDPQEEIQIYTAGTPEKELEEAARRIRRLVRTQGMKYGEIAVITGNLEEYGNIASQVFERAGIPYFVDEKHTVLMNPFVEYIRAAVEMVFTGFSYEGVFRYLRCGMSRLTREETDYLENYVIALGIRGLNRWQEHWTRIYRGMDAEDILKINESRARFVEEVYDFAEIFGKSRKKIEQYCRGLYDFIVKGQIQEKLKKQELYFKSVGDAAMEKEYGQIYGIVMDLLDRMVEILGDELVTVQEFRQLLETGLSKAKVALIPPSMDQVLVGDMERTRLKKIKALFFVGVNEGNIPKAADTGGILNEMDRDFFAEEGVELAPGPKELMNMQRFYLYLNLTKPEKLLCLSFSSSNSKGEAISPAYLIHTVTGLFPALKISRIEDGNYTLEDLEIPGDGVDAFLKGLSEGAYTAEDPLFGEVFGWLLRSPGYKAMTRKLVEAFLSICPKDMIGASVAKVLYGEVSPYSATRLERFAACAFAHFLQYGLRLSERAEYEFKAMDMGNVIHKALEEFSKELRRQGLLWADLSQEQQRQIADQCLEKVTADYGNTILKSSARNEYMIQRTRRLLHRTLWALQNQLKNGEFVPEGFEVVFQGGRIDRVDILEEQDKVYVKVIDYKTGNTTFDLVALYHGLQLQLLVYMDAALSVERRKYPDKEIVPAGIFYYNVKDPMIQEKIETDMESVNEEILKSLKMNGLVQKDPEIAQKIDKSLVSIPVSYKKDGGIKKGSSVADNQQFWILDQYVKKKIKQIRKDILKGDAQISPYELGAKNACTYCPYISVCGFDRKIPGYVFRRLKSFSDEELWKSLGESMDDQILTGEEER